VRALKLLLCSVNTEGIELWSPRAERRNPEASFVPENAALRLAEDRRQARYDENRPRRGEVAGPVPIRAAFTKPQARHWNRVLERLLGPPRNARRAYGQGHMWPTDELVARPAPVAFATANRGARSGDGLVRLGTGVRAPKILNVPRAGGGTRIWAVITSNTFAAPPVSHRRHHRRPTVFLEKLNR